MELAWYPRYLDIPELPFSWFDKNTKKIKNKLISKKARYLKFDGLVNISCVTIRTRQHIGLCMKDKTGKYRLSICLDYVFNVLFYIRVLWKYANLLIRENNINKLEFCLNFLFSKGSVQIPFALSYWDRWGVVWPKIFVSNLMKIMKFLKLNLWDFIFVNIFNKDFNFKKTFCLHIWMKNEE